MQPMLDFASLKPAYHAENLLQSSITMASNGTLLLLNIAMLKLSGDLVELYLIASKPA